MKKSLLTITIIFLSIISTNSFSLEKGKWNFVKDDNWCYIGSLPIDWNWLVGWYKEPKDGKPKALHYTEGGPWFKDYRNCEYNQVWKDVLAETMQGK